MRHILKCAKCGKYTMNDACSCGNKTSAAKPLKFSLEDRFSSYRRKAKLEEYGKRGLI